MRGLRAVRRRRHLADAEGQAPVRGRWRAYARTLRTATALSG